MLLSACTLEEGAILSNMQELRSPADANIAELQLSCIFSSNASRGSARISELLQEFFQTFSWTCSSIEGFRGLIFEAAVFAQVQELPGLM